MPKIAMRGAINFQTVNNSKNPRKNGGSRPHFSVYKVRFIRYNIDKYVQPRAECTVVQAKRPG